MREPGDCMADACDDVGLVDKGPDGVLLDIGEVDDVCLVAKEAASYTLGIGELDGCALVSSGSPLWRRSVSPVCLMSLAGSQPTRIDKQLG